MLKPTFVEDDKETGQSIRYWNCPVSLVPRCVWDWLGEYRYCKTFRASMPGIEELSETWYNAWLLYEHEAAQGAEYGRRNH